MEDFLNIATVAIQLAVLFFVLLCISGVVKVYFDPSKAFVLEDKDGDEVEMVITKKFVKKKSNEKTT